MRISRIDSFGGMLPPENPSMKICPPFGPIDGPASAWSAAANSSGSSGRASRSRPVIRVWLALFVDSVLRGAFALTLTCDSIAAIFRVMLTGSRRPAATSTGASSEVAKPAAVTWIIYLPGASPLKAYAPSALEVAVFWAPEASLRVMVAPRITAPASSTTEPRRLALACASAGGAARASVSRADAIHVVSFWEIIIPFCENG